MPTRLRGLSEFESQTEMQVQAALSEENGCNVTLPRTVSRALLVILRVYLGVILFITNLGKLTRDNPFATEMLRFLRGVATRRASAPYLHFVQNVVIPHATLFSYLVMTGEAVAALSFLTGTMTRVGAAVAMFLFLNYMLAEGRMFWSPDSEDAAAPVACGESTAISQSVGQSLRFGNLAL